MESTHRRLKLARWAAASSACLCVLTACAPVEDASMATHLSTAAPTHAPSGVGSSADGREEDLSSKQLSPVYWVGTVDGERRLYREFVRAHDHGDPVVTALRHLLNGMPYDSEYASLLSPTPTVGASIDVDNVITVDISSDAFRRTLDADDARLAVQQIVYTATAAAASAGLLSDASSPSVRLLVDGRSDREVFGHLRTGEPMPRIPELRAPIWIIEPQFGSLRSPGTVHVTGVGIDYPGGMHWRVERIGSAGTGTEADLLENPVPVDGGVVDVGRGDLPEDQFDVPVVLDDGLYRVSVWGEDGDGSVAGRESKVFRVAAED
ncbi:GerMN domain-containing protein [Zhihengliuella sp.]|uniref:GerMN domain-containing protein n=1 Tax=Zhihengliuella sp. TaxID=1954483 RepID=UPI0028119B1D|nr:GerMN domain-containing protein [Zhihengliuella sp.]